MLGTLKFTVRKRATGEPLNSPAKAFEAVRDIADLEQEILVVLLLNARYRLLGRVLVGLGTATGCMVAPRDVFLPAIEAGAVAIIVAHNHPSGDPRPSREDRELTMRLVKAGKLLGILVLDSLVVGGDEFRSLVEGETI